MKILYLLLCSFIAQLSYAQCDDSMRYSEIEKEKFVQTYLRIKEVKPQSQDELLYQLVNEYAISPQQFREIQHPQNSRRALTDNELLFVEELVKLKGNYRKSKVSNEKEICKIYQLEYSTYQSLEHQYKSCIKFQRSLSDYFKTWMK